MRCIGIGVLTLAIFLSGCAFLKPGGPPPGRYVITSQPRPDALPPTALTLGLRPLSSARPYHTSMMFLDTTGRLTSYETAEWAELPEAVLTRALTDALDATGRFEDVGNAADMARPDIILTGDIRSFHEDRGVSPAEAVVELHVAARIAQTKALVWSGLATARVPLTSGGAEGLRAAMEAAVTQAATEIATNTAAKAGV